MDGPKCWPVNIWNVDFKVKMLTSQHLKCWLLGKQFLELLCHLWIPMRGQSIISWLLTSRYFILTLPINFRKILFLTIFCFFSCFFDDLHRTSVKQNGVCWFYLFSSHAKSQGEPRNKSLNLNVILTLWPKSYFHERCSMTARREWSWGNSKRMMRNDHVQKSSQDR